MTFMPENFTVWVEIPVTDMDRSIAFYNRVFETELKLENGGPNPMAMFPRSSKSAVAGHLYPGKPAPAGSGSTIHLASPDALETARKRVTEAGGKVVSEIVVCPEGRFFYCQDPDGNSLGLFTG